ncbi:hypothetical protein [Deinococcus arenicola]|uniref:Uncharacterized protein n=1 Tax=Deinococcus arenicola TaxID=2994950 RepID=A0ABU4DUI5_9DEIO|nr:hypothetical protein [Deinococcus sp. ZS9-10]MDV6376104.1 hypothetical protein [Deinococcus sp. ZS9-10]
MNVLEQALDLSINALTIPGPAGQHAAAARESLRLARLSADRITYLEHLNSARQSVENAVTALQDTGPAQADNTQTDTAQRDAHTLTREAAQVLDAGRAVLALAVAAHTREGRPQLAQSLAQHAPALDAAARDTHSALEELTA